MTAFLDKNPAETEVDRRILSVFLLNAQKLPVCARQYSAVKAVIYRPPCYTISLFTQNLDTLLRWLHPLCITTIVMGDFNSNILKVSTICKFMHRARGPWLSGGRSFCFWRRGPSRMYRVQTSLEGFIQTTFLFQRRMVAFAPSSTTDS